GEDGPYARGTVGEQAVQLGAQPRDPTFQLVEGRTRGLQVAFFRRPLQAEGGLPRRAGEGADLALEVVGGAAQGRGLAGGDSRAHRLQRVGTPREEQLDLKAQQVLGAVDPRQGRRLFQLTLPGPRPRRRARVRRPAERPLPDPRPAARGGQAFDGLEQLPGGYRLGDVVV